MRRQIGFSLVEIVVVIAIILLLAAIAIPNYLRTRMAANEASAVSSIKSINTAQIAFAAINPVVGFADQLPKLGPTGADLLDPVLGCPAQPCRKSGYDFSIANALGNPITDFQVHGVPEVVNSTGTRGFCSNHLSQIKFDPNGGVNCVAIVE